MKYTRPLVLAIMFFSLNSFTSNADDKRMTMPLNGTASIQEHHGNGIINNVDVKTGRVSITHDPIATLGWDSMTMDFVVKDKTMLANLKKGQKVTFILVEARKGEYVISFITPTNE